VKLQDRSLSSLERARASDASVPSSLPKAGAAVVVADINVAGAEETAA